MRRLLAALAVVAVAACSDGGGEINAVDSSGGGQPVATTIATQTIRSWFLPAMPYATKISDQMGQLADSASDEDIQTVKVVSQALSDSVRSFRLALQAAGPVPQGAAVAGLALIESSSDMEDGARSLAACSNTFDCSAKVETVLAVMSSWTTAMEDISAQAQAGA